MTWSIIAGTPAAASGFPHPTLPAGWEEGDILLIIRGSRGDDTIPSVSRYTQLTGLPVYVDSNNGVGLSVFYKVAGETEDDPVVADAGNHNAAVILAIRGADVGDVINAIGTPAAVSESGAGISIPGLATDVDGCLVLTVGYIRENSSIESSANSDLTDLTEEVDWAHEFGNDGTLYAISGVKDIAGTVGATTATVTAPTDPNRYTGVTLALTPAAPAVDDGWVSDDVTVEEILDGVNGHSASRLTATKSVHNITGISSPEGSATHSMRVWLRKLAAGDSVEISIDGGATYTDISGDLNDSTYVKSQIEQLVSNPQIAIRWTTTIGNELDLGNAELHENRSLVELGNIPAIITGNTAVTVYAQGGEDQYGYWTPDSDWQFVPAGDNRIYRINDYPIEESNVLVDSDGGQNGEIHNIDPDNWE